MNLIRTLKIGTRLALGFGLLLVLVVAMAVFGVAGLHHMENTVLTGERTNTGQALAAYSMLAELNEGALATRDQLLAADAGERAAASERLLAAQRRYKEAEQRLATLIGADGSDAERAGLARIGQLQAAVQPVAERLARALQNARAGRTDEARRILAAELAPRHAAWAAAVKDMVRQQDQDLLAVDQGAARAYGLVRNILIAAAAVAMVLGVLAAWLLATSIVRPLEQAVAVAETVAAGDLSAAVDLSGRDEPARLLQALARMTGALAAVVSKVRSGSDSIAQGTAQIAHGNEDLAQRTEQQASNLQQTAASMEQLSSTVRSAADTAQQANALAASASQAAQQGGDVVEQVVQTMQGIQTSSRKVSEIIGVIDGIAFQTNILALNAAVEAARAGEHGRGFAVVATEVRALAQRSASAAREIKGLISDSVGKVESGSKLVGDAGRTMTDIVDQVRRVSLMIEQISSAATEQTLGISQVSEAVTQLDQVTQQNAALVEQLASAAGSLNSRSADLLGSVGTFRLPGGEPAPQPQAGGPGDAPASQAAPAADAGSAAANESAPRPASAAWRTPTARPAAAAPAAADSAEWTQF